MRASHADRSRRGHPGRLWISARRPSATAHLVGSSAHIAAPELLTASIIRGRVVVRDCSSAARASRSAWRRSRCPSRRRRASIVRALLEKLLQEHGVAAS